MRASAMRGAAVALILAAPAMAQGGYIDLSYVSSDFESSGSDESADGVQGGGAAAFQLGGLSLEIDGGVSVLDFDGDDVTVWGGEGHLYQRYGAWLFGGTLGVRSADGDGLDATAWLAALQTQYDLEQITLAGAASYSEVDEFNGQSQWGVDGEIRFFATDNLRLDGRAGWRDISFDGGGDSSDWHAGAGAELQLDRWPVSLFGHYLHTENDDADFSIDSFVVGLRWNWGGTLRQRNETGPRMMHLGDGLTANGL